MSSESNDTARDYYNSTDADTFYYNVWGGEDIHVGIYNGGDEGIGDASRRTVERMVSLLPRRIDRSSHVVDLGSGFGGAARHLARTFGCRLTGLNISGLENRRHREMNKSESLTGQISIVEGSFDSIPVSDGSVDVVWSQDAILHSGDRTAVIEEVHRVLRNGGQFVFTDPMQSDDCPPGVLQPILDRIHLSSLASPTFYREAGKAAGLESLVFQEMTHHLVRHYERVLGETIQREDKLRSVISSQYVENMKKGLGHWIEGGKKGYLSWGIFVFAK